MPRSVGRLLPLLLFLPLLACGGEPDAALRVEGVAYTQEEVGRLTEEQLRSLVDLTALGVAVANNELESVGEPLAERAAHLARADALPWLLAAEATGTGEAELREAYAAEPEWELTVRHIVRLVPRWAPARERAEARDRVEEARRRALAGEDFAVLAGEISEEPGAAERGGRLQPGREGTWVGPFWEAALALAPGEISPVVETEYGFHVLRLDARGPVPFEEASRARVLQRAIPEVRAAAAMEGWMIRNATALRVDRDAALRAREAARRGSAPDTPVIAEWTAGEGRAGGRYTGRDLALLRATLEGEEWTALERMADDAFVDRIERDAREAMWAAEAERLGAVASEPAAAEARRGWLARAGRWGNAAGFRAGMGEEEIRAAALRALAGSGQELRITRIELAGPRPLLWSRYRVSGTALPPSAAESSSETRNSESTG